MNKVMIKGWVGKDPIKRWLPSGDPVCGFSVAVKSGEHTEWCHCVGYNKLAEVAAEFKKGDLIFFEGEMRTRKWKGEDGRERKVLELVAHEIFLVKPSSLREVSVEEEQGKNGFTDDSSSQEYQAGVKFPSFC